MGTIVRLIIAAFGAIAAALAGNLYSQHAYNRPLDPSVNFLLLVSGALVAGTLPRPRRQLEGAPDVGDPKRDASRSPTREQVTMVAGPSAPQ